MGADMKKVQESSIPNLLQLHVKQIENCGGSVFKIFADQEKPAAAARLAVLSSPTPLHYSTLSSGDISTQNTYYIT